MLQWATVTHPQRLGPVDKKAALQYSDDWLTMP